MAGLIAGSMAGLTPLPPTVTHSSSRLTHAQAHAMLSSFLERAENDAAYRPDSTLTERGPQSASSGSNPNLTLHHLKRILSGIEGKKIGGEDVGRFFGDGARAAGLNSGLPFKRKADENGNGEVGVDSPAKRRMVGDAHPEHGDDGTGIAVVGEANGWQSKDDYDLAQREGNEDLLNEDKQPGMNLEQPTNEKEAVDKVNVAIEGTGEKVDPRKGDKADKESRKKAKKDRRKEDKKSRQEARTKN